METPRNCAMPPLTEANLRAMMASHVGVVRNGDHLMEALQAFAAIEQDTGNIALRNMATTALIVAASAWSRRESRGAHFRSDHPAEDSIQRKRTMTTLAKARRIAASMAGDKPVAKLASGA
jgi:L-aspartate oxidase